MVSVNTNPETMHCIFVSLLSGPDEVSLCSWCQDKIYFLQSKWLNDEHENYPIYPAVENLAIIFMKKNPYFKIIFNTLLYSTRGASKD